MPMHLDQPLNARLVEEVGVAMEVIRDENGRLNREAIAQVVRKIVVEKSGEDIRIKSREFSEKIRMCWLFWLLNVIFVIVSVPARINQSLQKFN
ncbi:unnamed protein product [Camellia sinensis]